MGRWTPPRVRCSRARSDRRDRANRRCGGRDAGGVPPARRRRCRAASSPPASGGRPPPWSWSRWPRIAFGPARRSLGVAVTVWDDAVVRWLAGLRLPGMTGVMESIVGFIGSAGMVSAFRWETVIALLVLRRFRHLVVFVGSFLAVLLAVRLATVDRPRPFGVELRGSWGGWAMPSRPVAILAATLVGMLYTLVPVGRWRQLGKWVATGLVASVRPGPDPPGRGRPHRRAAGRRHRGRGVGGRLPAVCAQRDLPGHLQAGPQRPPGRGRPPRRGDPPGPGRPARADRARGRAVRAVRLGRVDPAADPGPGRGRHHPLCLRQAVRQEPSPRRPLLQARPGAAVWAAGGREAVQHRQAAGPAGGLRAGPDAAGRPAQPRAVRCRRAHPRAGVPDRL